MKSGSTDPRADATFPWGEAQEAATPLPDLPRDFGGGRRVVVLGAGIARLLSADEFEQAGVDVTVLEARSPVGGRA